MKTFTRHRTPKEIREKCEALCLPFVEEQFDRGSDYVSFQFRHRSFTLQVCYSTVNGRAFGEFWRGKEGKRSRFSTDTTEHESRPWFKALLNFIYVS